MKISIITVFSELHETFISHGIIAKAIEKKLVEFNLVKLSSLFPPKVRIDEPTCGPGVGMIIKPEAIELAINKCEQQWGKGLKIFFSPQGKKVTQKTLTNLAQQLLPLGQEDCAKPASSPVPHIIFVCTRYEGTDARVEQHYADHIFSIGDYVLMGGDLPAQVIIESFLRLVPEVIGKQQSVEEDSFSGSFLDHPHYGLPATWNNLEIPEILRSGNHAAIETWRKQEACKNTIFKRFDWFRSQQPLPEEIELAKQYIPNHYLVLMHSQVLIKDQGKGNTSIASLDIHDIARSSRTYGIKNFFLVSELQDQQHILSTFLNFWHSSEGKEYNQSRFDAVSLVKPAFNLHEVITTITEQEQGITPLIVSTSAKKHTNAPVIDYAQQGQLWQQQRPILFIFGTGQGLADEILDQSNYILAPIKGLTSYNHLSVRSAVAIILDRWLGLQPNLS